MKTLTWYLSPDESDRWREGHYSAWRTEEDVIEALLRRDVRAPVEVLLDNGTLAFGVLGGTITALIPDVGSALPEGPGPQAAALPPVDLSRLAATFTARRCV